MYDTFPCRVITCFLHDRMLQHTSRGSWSSPSNWRHCDLRILRPRMAIAKQEKTWDTGIYQSMNHGCIPDMRCQSSRLSTRIYMLLRISCCCLCCRVYCWLFFCSHGYGPIPKHSHLGDEHPSIPAMLILGDSMGCDPSPVFLRPSM